MIQCWRRQQVLPGPYVNLKCCGLEHKRKEERLFFLHMNQVHCQCCGDKLSTFVSNLAIFIFQSAKFCGHCWNSWYWLYEFSRLHNPAKNNAVTSNQKSSLHSARGTDKLASEHWTTPCRLKLLHEPVFDSTEVSSRARVAPVGSCKKEYCQSEHVDHIPPVRTAGCPSYYTYTLPKNVTVTVPFKCTLFWQSFSGNV